MYKLREEFCSGKNPSVFSRGVKMYGKKLEQLVQGIFGDVGTPTNNSHLKFVGFAKV